MKPMRLIILFAACLFTMAAIAQQNPPSQENGDHKHGGQMHQGMPSVDDHVKDLTTKLNLTPDQQTKMKELHESAKAKARDILTDDQKPKFDAMMKDMEAQMHSRHDGDKAPK
jgi:Spy/CpxP family protein refolding chaperone